MPSAARAPSSLGPQWKRIWGTKKAQRENDPFWLADQLDPKQAPAIWLDCGREDGLLSHNQELHRHLKRLKVKHEYHEFPGGHSWPYWDEHVREALAFHCQVLGIA